MVARRLTALLPLRVDKNGLLPGYFSVCAEYEEATIRYVSIGLILLALTLPSLKPFATGRYLLYQIRFIVPSGVYSVVQKLCRNIVVPKLKALGQSKINVTAHTVPKLGYKRCAVFILYKKPFFGYFVVHRCDVKKAGLILGIK